MSSIHVNSCSVLCPSFSFGFNETFLASIGLTQDQYKDGKWLGNSSEGERAVFDRSTFRMEAGENSWIIRVSHGFIALVLEINVKLTNGEKRSFKAENINLLSTFEVFMTTLGRCYEIQLMFSGKPQPVAAVEFLTRVPVYIYVNMPGQTTNEDSKSKVEVKMKQRLYIDVNSIPSLGSDNLITVVFSCR